MSEERVYKFDELWNEEFVTDFKTTLLICQSKANLYEKPSFGRITDLLDQNIGKMLARDLHGNKNFTCIACY